MPNEKQTNSGLDEQSEGKVQLPGQGWWGEQSSPGMEGLVPKGSVRAQPRHTGLIWGCKSTKGCLKNWSLIACGIIEVGND